jgi:hypothetical protein
MGNGGPAADLDWRSPEGDKGGDVLLVGVEALRRGKKGGGSGAWSLLRQRGREEKRSVGSWSRAQCAVIGRQGPRPTSVGSGGTDAPRGCVPAWTREGGG